MAFRADPFRLAYVAQGGSSNSARSYVSYLNRADRLLNGIDEAMVGSSGDQLLRRAEGLPDASFGGTREKRDSMAALRKYIQLDVGAEETLPPSPRLNLTPVHIQPSNDDLEIMLREAKSLAVRYRRLTGKPLGMTGEIAELAAASLLNLELAPARTRGYDALRIRDGQATRIQIKGRAIDIAAPYKGRCPSIKCGDLFDVVALVLLDRETMEPIEILEADEASVIARLKAPGSKARNDRSSLGISQFRSIARRVWSCSEQTDS